MVQTTSFPSHEVFSDELVLIVGIAASFLLALVIYVSVGSFLKPNSHLYYSYLVKNLQVLVSSLYIFHQSAHWAMTYYAQTRLKCSNSLKPFHYCMVGMNLVFVLLYIVQCRLVPDNIFYQDAKDLNMGTLYLYLWIVIAKGDRRGIALGYSIPYTQGVSEFFEKRLPYFFSFIILLNFWYKPFIEKLFFVRIFLDLILITHSCLIQTRIYENKYWTLFLELMVMLCFFVKVIASFNLPYDFSALASIVFAVFVISAMPFFTRMIKFMTALCLIALFSCFYFWNSPIFVMSFGLFYLCFFCLIIFYSIYFIVKIFVY